MGYFGVGLVLWQSQPDWTRLANLPESLALRAYRYRHGQLWAVDFWRPSRQPHTYPFISGREHRVLAELPIDGTIEAFDRITSRLKSDAHVYGGGWLRLTWAAAEALRQDVFLFAADDEETDMACRASPGGLTVVACRFGPYAIRYAAGGWAITPRRFPEDGEDEHGWSPALLSELRADHNVEVREPIEVAQGERLYENPAAEWPPEAGDPAKVFGLGQWNVFENVTRDFDVEFERVPAVPEPLRPVVSTSSGASQPVRAWWQFWRK